jgi:hypothetical protein
MKAGYIAKLPQAWSDLQGLAKREMATEGGYDSFCNLLGGLDEPDKFDPSRFGFSGQKVFEHVLIMLNACIDWPSQRIRA